MSLPPVRLDPDLARHVRRVTVRPLVGGLVGLAGVVAIVAIDVLVYGGAPTPVGYLSIALGVCVLESVLAALGVSVGRVWRAWAVTQQQARALPPEPASRVLVTAVDDSGER